MFRILTDSLGNGHIYEPGTVSDEFDGMSGFAITHD